MKLIKVQCIKDFEMDEEEFKDYPDRTAFVSGNYYCFVEYKPDVFVGFDSLSDKSSHIMELKDLEEYFNMENVSSINIDYYIEKE